MKILHAITGMQKAAGTSVFCGEILNELAKAGEDCRLLVQKKSDDFYPVNARIRIFEGDVRQVCAEGWCPDVVHIHALWSPWLSKVYRWARRNGVKVVWSPHGMITPWALGQKKWKKRLALALYQLRGLKGADLIHVTAESEVEDVRRLGLKNKIAIVPLGVDCSGSRRYARDDGHTPIRHCEARSDEAIRNEPIHTALFISRVHPKKGLFDLVDAWGVLKPQGWRLIIAGPSFETHAEYVIRRARALGLGEDVVQYVGPVFGEGKDELYAEADLFVLPTYSENFGVVVLEALAQGCPVITTKGAPWAELETYDCGKWIETGVASLVPALREMMALSDEQRAAMGTRGRKLVEEKYTWPAIALQMKKAYEGLNENAGGVDRGLQKIFALPHDKVIAMGQHGSGGGGVCSLFLRERA